MKFCACLFTSYQECHCQLVKVPVLVSKSPTAPLVVVIVDKHQCMEPISQALELKIQTEHFNYLIHIHL